MTSTIDEPLSIGTDPAMGPIAAEVDWPESIPQLFESLATWFHPVFFDSARIDSCLGRYSFLSAAPFETIRSRAGYVEVRSQGRRIFAETSNPFTVLAKRLRGMAMRSVPGLPPFQGGAAGLFSYDLCHHQEQLPRARVDEFAVPDMVVGLYDWVLSLDHLQRRAWLVSTGYPHTGARRLEHARARLDQVRQFLCAMRALGSRKDRHGELPRLGPARPRVGDRGPAGGRIQLAELWDVAAVPGVASNLTRDGYLRRVERAIDYIHAGDVYQVNLSHRLVASPMDSPAALYLRLRERNPSPFAGYLDFGDFVIASASPERFLKVQDGAVETRPIKGTRPRWPQPEADMYSAGELRESEKDRAENVMIVDLLRNDLGRVCDYGSIEVSDPLRLESYKFVHHLVSEVRGRLRPECDAIDLLLAAFPGGSVTGVPKIRAMEIIAELEPTVRGPYCGSLGYLGFDGSMDTNILIRTFTCGRGWVQFPVGGGIVAQSSPQREYEETLHKAEGMIRALA